MERSSVLRRPRLVALAVGTVLLEAGLLWWLAPPGALSLAPHVTAPEPFGVFHDVRWVLVYHPSLLAFVGEVLALVLFRSALVALLVREAWPDGFERPAWTALWRRSAAFTAVVALLLSPWAALEFGIALMSLSWLFFVTIPVMLAIALLVHHGAVAARWWRDPPPLRTMGWTLLAFAVLTMTGALLAEVPAGFRLPVVAAGGLFNAWAWTGVVGAVVTREPRVRLVPLTPVGVTGLVAVASLGTFLGFEVARPAAAHHEVAQVEERGKPVMLVAGFGSQWTGEASDRLPEGFRERRFSYQGMDGGGEPRLYTGEDTYRSLAELASDLGAQVEELHRDTGRPVSIVAESQGALVAKTYLVADPHAPVDRLVMLSPLVRPGRVYYPPSGEDGWGVATSWELRGLMAVIRGLTPLSVSADTELFRSVADHAPLLRSIMACPVEGVRELVVVPVADAVVASAIDAGTSRVIAVPAFHGGLMGNEQVQRIVADELRGRSPDGSEAWSKGDRIVRALSAAWQVPELALSLNPVWADDEPGCPGARTLLREWATGGDKR